MHNFLRIRIWSNILANICSRRVGAMPQLRGAAGQLICSLGVRTKSGVPSVGAVVATLVSQFMLCIEGLTRTHMLMPTVTAPAIGNIRSSSAAMTPQSTRTLPVVVWQSAFESRFVTARKIYSGQRPISRPL